jgi:D-beta-D-heptose 7-phosphate kinase/D-beta-D-heptose 1-phosphate adenosyltransferase
MGAVDWIVSFAEDTPIEVIGKLQPDILVKGHEYDGLSVPGDLIVPEVRIAPPGPFRDVHATRIVEAIQGR